ncbi:hypothetical protein ACRAWD_16740 [Caulobacter segnis]
MRQATMRTFPLVLSGLIAGAAPLSALAAPSPKMMVAGPGRPGRLADALLALAAQADVNIAFDAALVGDRRTRGFMGPHHPARRARPAAGRLGSDLHPVADRRGHGAGHAAAQVRTGDASRPHLRHPPRRRR